MNNSVQLATISISESENPRPRDESRCPEPLPTATGGDKLKAVQNLGKYKSGELACVAWGNTLGERASNRMGKSSA